MAFNYGKNTIEIKNPFKIEGLLDLIFGGFSLILGILLLFKVRVTIDAGFQNLAWFKLLLSLIFIIVSLRFILIGSFRVFRFLIGRDIPSNISPYPYDDKTIEKVLMNRSNPTFIEKNDFISRLLISIYSKFLFLPIGFRNLLESVSSLFISFILFFTIYLLTIFSTNIGLIKLTDKKSIIIIFTVVFLLKQLFVWYYYRPNNKRISSIKPNIYGYKDIVINILIAIFIPFLLEISLRKGLSIPNLELNTFLPISLLFIFSILLVLITYFLSSKRLEILNPETSVSEYKEHIQVSVHPKDIFRCFELEMANKRYKELPNRIYKEINPTLELEGSENKGSFTGSTIQETQPIYNGDFSSKIIKTVRFFASLLGRVLLLSSFIYLFFSIETLSNELSFNLLFNSLYYPLLTSIFSYYLIRIGHLFYSEILFSSYLVHFFSNGTYTESKISTGMSVYDSNRSENTIVNTSATPWILVSKITTSTFADSSTRNLEGSRYILEMHKGEAFLNDLVDGFNNYLKNRKLIVGFESKSDIENTLNFHKLNDLTRTKKSTNNIEEHQQNRIDE